MGTSRTTAQFAGKLARMADKCAHLPRETARVNADIAETVIGSAVSSMAHGDRLDRVGSGRGAPAGVRAIPVPDGAVIVTPRGPVWLVENPTSAHLIGAGRGRTTNRGGRSFVAGLEKSYDLDLGQPLNFSGSPEAWITGPVPHPGTAGKGAWKRARDSELPDRVKNSTAKAMASTVMEVFG